MKQIDFMKIAGGKLAAQLNMQFEKAVLNMLDPNTDQRKKRTINLKIVLEPNEDCNGCTVSCTSDFKPVPHNPCKTMMAYGRNLQTNEVAVKEYPIGGIPGQMSVEDMCDTETGEIKQDFYANRDLRKHKNIKPLMKEA